MSDDQSGGRGTIGNEIFEQVEQLVSSEGLSRTQAFQRISETSGRRAGTVAANYYRVARQRGATLQARGPRSGRRGGAATQATAQSALTRAQEALTELMGVVESQQEEINRLRDQAAAYEKARAFFAEQ